MGGETHIPNPLDNLDYTTLYMQKMAILAALDNGGKLPTSVLEGLLYLLDDIGEYGEAKSYFKFPPPEEEIQETHPFKLGDKLLYDDQCWSIDKTNIDFKEPDKMIVLSDTTGETFIVDVYGRDDILEEIGGTVLGVYTRPECPAILHDAKITRPDIPCGVRDNLDDGLHYRLEFGNTYDVIYNVRVPKTGIKHEAADLHLTAGEIFIHIGMNRYLEGALIFDRAHMLTPEEYFSGMRYNSLQRKGSRTGIEDSISAKEPQTLLNLLENAKGRCSEYEQHKESCLSHCPKSLLERK